MISETIIGSDDKNFSPLMNVNKEVMLNILEHVRLYLLHIYFSVSAGLPRICQLGTHMQQMVRMCS